MRVNTVLQKASALIGDSLREGCGKSKWKFKMAFAMKGGEGLDLEGVSIATYLF